MAAADTLDLEFGFRSLQFMWRIVDGTVYFIFRIFLGFETCVGRMISIQYLGVWICLIFSISFLFIENSK